MIFNELPRVFPEQALWGATSETFSFVISHDVPDGFTASTKVLGALPFDNTRHDLGGYAAYKTLEEAKEACEKFLRERN